MRAAVLVMLAVAACTSASGPQKPTLVPPETLDWSAATARNGIRRIPLDGDRTGPGLFAERLVFPAGFSAPPHRHPIDLEETEIHMMGSGAMATEYVPVAGGR